MSAIISSTPEFAFRLEHVSDVDLLTNTRQLIGRSNQLLAALLAHLAEVEARGIHRQRACSSLYTYCIYELRLSEDAAFRRARAAKLARQFPVIFQQIANGELQLSTLLLLAPHLTETNHIELLALAKYRTKREVQRLVRCLSPEHDVPDRVEPLGPGPIGLTLPSAPNWNQFAESFAPSVRELPHGDRPIDWVDSTDVSAPVEGAATARAEVPTEVPADSMPQRYRVEFTASQEYADLLDRAQDLLSHAVPNRSLEEVHVRALRLLVEKLERRKYGAPSTHTRTKAVTAAAPQAPASGESPALVDTVDTVGCKNRTHAPRRRVAPSAGVRREVRDRDGACCTFVDDTGQRCREPRFLQLHHQHAHACGGQDSAENLTLRCQAHNALAAEQDFGRAYIRRQQDRHRQRRH